MELRPCRVRVVSGAEITKDDLYTQFFYRPKCPRCGMLTEGEAAGAAFPDEPFNERSYCPKCNMTFDIRVERD